MPGLFVSPHAIGSGFCGRSQRKNMLFYKLDKSIPSEKLLSDISKLVSKEQDTSNKILTIYIRDISDYGGDSLLKKLPYYNDKETNLSGTNK